MVFINTELGKDGKCNKCNNKAIIKVKYNGKMHYLCYPHYESFYNSVPEGVLDWGLINQKRKEPIIAPHRMKKVEKQSKQKNEV